MSRMKQVAPRRKNVNLARRELKLESFDDVARFSSMVAKSGLAPKSLGTPEKIGVALVYGGEIGLSPMQALQSIAVINGKPTLFGDGLLAIAQGSGELESFEELFEGDVAICRIKRRGFPCLERRFSMSDAKRAKLAGKQGPWQDYPERMLQMRARAFALRDSFSDWLRGIGAREEVLDYTTREVPFDEGPAPRDRPLQTLDDFASQ